MSPRRLGPASIVRLLGAWRAGRAGPAYRQLADGLRLLILDGRLPLDVVLPGERELAQVLEVSRTTVTAAFYDKRIRPSSPRTIAKHDWEVLQLLVTSGADVSSPKRRFRRSQQASRGIDDPDGGQGLAVGRAGIPDAQIVE